MNWIRFVTFLEYSSTAFAFVCLPVNLLFLFMIYTSRKRPPFNAPFFELCCHLTIADILMMLFSTVCFKFPIYGWLPSWFMLDKWAFIPVSGVSYFGHAQALGVVAIALNR